MPHLSQSRPSQHKPWPTAAAALAALLLILSGVVVADHKGKPHGGPGGDNDGGGAITNPALVFEARSRKSKSSDIFVRTADGSSELQLTKDDLLDAWPAWSPDGKQIAFLRQRVVDAPEVALYLMNADGTGLRLLKDFVADQEPLPPDFGATPFDWSPDGTMIVLNGLYVLDVATGEGSYLLGVPDEGDGYQPAWSPDGTMIAYANYVQAPGGDTGTWDLFLVDLATLNVVNLTSNIGRNSLPAWSPDGSLIAFVSDGELAVMTLADGTVDVIVQDPDFHISFWDSRPTWSPDGGDILFAAHLSGPSGGNWDLFRVSPTGTGLSNITVTDRRSEAQVDWNPAW